MRLDRVAFRLAVLATTAVFFAKGQYRRRGLCSKVNLTTIENNCRRRHVFN